jgi:DNA-binding GntR family transcriptional regulator
MATAQIVRASATAMYAQISNQILQQIQAGIYKPGDKLPTEPDLMRVYDVSRITVRRAVSDLVERGILTTRQGKGTFLKASPISQDISSISRLVDQIRFDSDQDVKMRVLSAGYADPSELRKDIIGKYRGKTLKIHRLITKDDFPIATTIMYILHNFGKFDEKVLDDNWGYDLIEKHCKRKVATTSVTIRGIPAPGTIRDILQIPADEIVLNLERISFDSSLRPMEYLVLYANTKYFQFRTSMTKDNYENSVRHKLTMKPES